MAKVIQGDGLERLRTGLQSIGKASLGVGFFDTAVYPGGTPVAYVASIQEFGWGPIPPRSFMRTTVAEKRNVWEKNFVSGFKAVLNGTINVNQVYEQIGMRIVGDIKRKISSIQDPALSPLTLMARKDRRDHAKNAKKNANFGPQQQFKMTGTRIGELSSQLDMGPQNFSGVSTKPLVDTSYMLNSVDYKVST